MHMLMAVKIRWLLLCAKNCSRHWEYSGKQVSLFGRVCLMCDNVSTLRFINTLHKEVNISLTTDIFLSVGEDYGVSAYITVQSGE